MERYTLFEDEMDLAVSVGGVDVLQFGECEGETVVHILLPDKSTDDQQVVYRAFLPRPQPPQEVAKGMVEVQVGKHDAWTRGAAEELAYHFRTKMDCEIDEAAIQLTVNE